MLSAIITAFILIYLCIIDILKKYIIKMLPFGSGGNNYPKCSGSGGSPGPNNNRPSIGSVLVYSEEEKKTQERKNENYKARENRNRK